MSNSAMDTITHDNDVHNAISHLEQPYTITQSLKRLMDMDKYFRNYQLFKEYQHYKYKNQEALDEIGEKIQRIAQQGRNQATLEEFRESLSEVESHNAELEEQFAEYDFSDTVYQDMVSDYLIETYLFVKENIRTQLGEALEKNANSNQNRNEKKENIPLFEYVSRKLWDFFSRNFVIVEGVEDAFNKAIHNAWLSSYEEGYE